MPGLVGNSLTTIGFAYKAPAVMVNGDTLFTVTNGPILIQGLVSVCITANGATASTLQYSITPTIGAAAQTISAASSSLANATAGATVSLVGTALSTAASYNVNGPNLGMNALIICPTGAIKIVVGVGSTTGTWAHYLNYMPMTSNASVA
jgi:hypothetical protein